MPTKDFQRLNLGDALTGLDLYICRRCGSVVGVTPYINGVEIHDDRVHTPDEADDLCGWTPEENAEWQRRAGVVFEKFVGQPLNDRTLARFKEDMLEEGIPAEAVGITMDPTEGPQLTVVFAHKTA